MAPITDNIPTPSGSNPGDIAVPIYDVLPDGLIDLPSAAAKHGLSRHTLKSWVKRGNIARRGRLKAKAPGGGYLVVAESELLDWINAPKDKGGRPPNPK